MSAQERQDYLELIFNGGPVGTESNAIGPLANVPGEDYVETLRRRYAEETGFPVRLLRLSAILHVGHGLEITGPYKDDADKALRKIADKIEQAAGDGPDRNEDEEYRKWQKKHQSRIKNMRRKRSWKS